MRRSKAIVGGRHKKTTVIDRRYRKDNDAHPKVAIACDRTLGILVAS
jgi:hypothetical protein